MSHAPNTSALRDALDLTQALIRRPSITPNDEGALDVLQEALNRLGFTCERMPFADDGRPRVDNLYARLGRAAPNFCFAGHTDVVPVGSGWTQEPFEPKIVDGRLYGRGASDMKSAIAAFVAAVVRFLEAHGAPSGSISLLITGDEEGEAINGTVKVLDRLKSRGETLDACVVGEPTNPNKLGEMIKIGRRGSLNARLTVHGTQGHAGYPHLADNPIPRLLHMLNALTAAPLDNGSRYFEPSTLVITTIDVGNPVTNVIPAVARAGFNIRFNDLHSGDSLRTHLKKICDAEAGGGRYELEIKVSGESFVTAEGPLTALVDGAVRKVLGTTPELSTTGGTSDARFIKNMCPVCEFGMVGATIHKADEHCAVDDIEKLTRVYLAILEDYFRKPKG